MAKNKAKLPHQFTIPTNAQVPQTSFNLSAQDSFIISHGIQFSHYKALPSPIGLKDRGDYRRSGELDVQSSNGFLYKSGGCFSAVFLNNSDKSSDIDGGLLDAAQARITLPRFYNKGEGFANGNRIYLSPGDKIYVKDKTIDMSVANFQEVEYEPNKENFLQFPAICVELLIDSRGLEYYEGRDFTVSKNGNIKWMAKGRNPGVDPDTGKGRVFSVRYRYDAHWYVVSLINEVRIGNVTEDGVRKEERFPYQAMVVREYVFHNRNRGEETKEKPKLVEIEDQDRKNPQDQENFSIPKYIKVNMDDEG